MTDAVGARDTSSFVVRTSYFPIEGFAGPDLIHEEGDYRAAGGHHVVVADAAEHGSGAVEVPGAGNPPEFNGKTASSITTST